MRKIVCIVGPTGVGKTDLALKISQEFNGELVSADAVQVFKDLDIISGKDLPKGYTFHAGYYSSNTGPSIHLLDVVSATSSFTLADFYKKSQNAIDLIEKRGKLPIVVGGTGLYVQTILYGLKSSAKPDAKLRSKLEGLDISDLQKELKKIDPYSFENMNDSDRQNKRRLIRRVEIEKSRIKNQELKIKKKNYESSMIGLTCDREVLKLKIDKRVNDRLQDGALKEAESLFQDYENLSPQVKNANGYKQLFSYLKKEIDFNEAIYRWKISEYRHTKNQMTWFRKYGNVEWFDVETIHFKEKIKRKIKCFL